jgi:DNA-binding response OmpR family regulator
MSGATRAGASREEPDDAAAGSGGPHTQSTPPPALVRSVLVVEDDAHLRMALADNLEGESLRVTVASTGAEARRALAEPGASFALILLDIMLPDDDGYAICRDLRARGSDVMILMLTARTLEDDLVRGFEAGADDYLAKPYRLRELLARVHALLRRRGAAPPADVIACGELIVDLPAREVRDTAGVPIELTRTEFDLLVCLLRSRGCVMSRRAILDEVWGAGVVVDFHTVDNFVSSLKRKLGWGGDRSARIRAVRGVGYRLELDE